MLPILGAILTAKLMLAAISCLGLAMALGMASPGVRDALLKVTKALPNGAASVTSGSIDTGRSTSQGVQEDDGEFQITAPALTTGELADAATMTYDVIVSASADLSNPTTVYPKLLVQTGAGGAGAAAAAQRFRLPSNAGQYVGFKATNSGAGNASGKSGVLEYLA